tara:strand:- start:248 stop:469 length:222 start_codon:yes stop_codon:yes gene_type:complete
VGKLADQPKNSQGLDTGSPVAELGIVATNQALTVENVKVCRWADQPKNSQGLDTGSGEKVERIQDQVLQGKKV